MGGGSGLVPLTRAFYMPVSPGVAKYFSFRDEKYSKGAPPTYPALRVPSLRLILTARIDRASMP